MSCLQCVLSCSAMSDSLQACGLQPTRLLCAWNFPGKSIGGGMLCPPPGDHPTPGIEPVSLTVQLCSLPMNHCGRPCLQFSSVQLLSRVPFFAGVGRRQREPREVSKKPLYSLRSLLLPGKGLAPPAFIPRQLNAPSLSHWKWQVTSVLMGNTMQACRNSPSSEPERQPMEPIMH